MLKRILLLVGTFVAFAPMARADEITSVTVEGGPIATHHFQSGKDNFRDGHELAVAKVETQDYGTWGVYFLNPNSVDKTSVGAGYVTHPYVIPLIGQTRLELTGALGLVTGYQDYPVPLIAGEARFVLYEQGPWNAGLSVAALPYIVKDDARDETKAGIVATTPFLSVQYKFN